MKVISDYQILNHGVENSQYFQGCGVAYTTFSEVTTGIGRLTTNELNSNQINYITPKYKTIKTI